jgi:hypothetical protein
MATLLCLLALNGCASVQFMGTHGTTIGTYWGSNTCCGATWSPVPTASAGGNAGH